MSNLSVPASATPTTGRKIPSWWGTPWWWIGIVGLCCILSAHLIASGPSFVVVALVLTVLVLHFGWYWPAHSRLMAWCYGFLIAFGVLVLVELYLGATGLHYGPIGSEKRGILLGGPRII